MLNNAWPSNIWHLYDYFFAPTPSYFATKKAGEKIHAMYNYENKKIYLINNYFSDFDDLIKLHIYIFSDDGKTEIYHKYFEFKGLKSDEINNSFIVLNQEYGDNYIIHLEYSYNENYKEISLSNTYLLNKIMDEIDYETPPTFYNVPISNYANLEAFDSLNKVDLNIEMISNTIFEEDEQKKIRYEFNIENNGDVIALLLELKLFYKSQNNNEMIVPIIWSDNYFSIRSKNSYKVTAEFIYEEGKEGLGDDVAESTDYTLKGFLIADDGRKTAIDMTITEAGVAEEDDSYALDGFYHYESQPATSVIHLEGYALYGKNGWAEWVLISEGGKERFNLSVSGTSSDVDGTWRMYPDAESCKAGGDDFVKKMKVELH